MLYYYLRWYGVEYILEAKKAISPKNIKGGFILIGDGSILSKICNGIYLEVEKQGICMIGKRK